MQNTKSGALHSLKENQHENFEVAEPRKERKKIVRQDRIEPEPGVCFVEIKGKPYEVINFGTFGIAIECSGAAAQAFAREIEFVPVPFIYSDTEVQTLH